MVVILHTVFMADYLAVQFVDQIVYRRVQIFVGAFCKHIATLHVDVALSALPSLFFLLLLYRQQDFDVNDLVKVSDDSI